MSFQCNIGCYQMATRAHAWTRSQCQDVCTAEHSLCETSELADSIASIPIRSKTESGCFSLGMSCLGICPSSYKQAASGEAMSMTQ